MLSDLLTITSELPIFCRSLFRVVSPHPMTQQPPVGQGLLIIEASRSHSDTSHFVGLLWTNDRPDAEASTWQHITLTRDGHLWLRWDLKASEPPNTHGLDRAITEIGFLPCYWVECSWSIRQDLPVFSQSRQLYFVFKNASLGVRKATEIYCTFHKAHNHPNYEFNSFSALFLTSCPENDLIQQRTTLICGYFISTLFSVILDKSHDIILYHTTKAFCLLLSDIPFMSTRCFL